MADYVKFNDVAAGDIVKIDGAAIGSVAKMNACDTPSSGATRIVLGFDDASISWANIADRATVSTWETNYYEVGASQGDSWELTDIACGKDGNGAPFFVAVTTSNNPEIIHDDDGDITDGARWTEINLGAGGQPAGNLKQYTALWGNNVWVTSGAITANDKYIYRSTNGSTWAAVDVSGLTDIGGISLPAEIRALTSDGAGKWWFGVGAKLYYSSDDAASWDLHATFSGEIIQDLAYTNSTLVALVKESGLPHLRAAASSDTTDFSDKVQLISSSQSLSGNYTKRMAAAAGRVVAIDTSRSMAADVSGKTITIQGTRQDLPDSGNLNCICTDGSGTWWTGSDGASSGGTQGGDLCESTDNGLSWGSDPIAEGISASGQQKIEGITTDVYLPL